MQNQEQAKSFAFRLAGQKSRDGKPAQAWKVRDGVSVAGCSVLDEEWAPERETTPRLGTDGGDYC